MPDEPLEPMGSEGGSHSAAIDFAEVQIQRGRTSRNIRACEHNRLLYSPSERRIRCRDCERTIDAFDTFMTITRHFHEMARDVEDLLAELGHDVRHETDRRWVGRFGTTFATHLQVKRRERCWIGFKSPGTIQRFLFAHDAVHNAFKLRRRLILGTSQDLSGPSAGDATLSVAGQCRSAERGRI